MTILTGYAPETFVVNDDRSYAFTFPAADDASIRFYEIIDVGGTEYQWLVPIQDYKLLWYSPSVRYPLKQNGVVVFSRKHSLDTTSVVIARNTGIFQKIDFPKVKPFNGRLVEFALDKAMMICQEIAQRKCNVVVNTAMTQEIVFSAYDEFKAALINFQVQKTFDVLLEIDNSADDCTDDLENT